VAVWRIRLSFYRKPPQEALSEDDVKRIKAEVKNTPAANPQGATGLLKL
jgi:hypothetical protein